MKAGRSIDKLLEIASPPLLNAVVDVAAEAGVASGSALGSHQPAIVELLSSRNGFFAFEGALRVFPSRSVPISYGLDEWNSATLWRDGYADLARGCFFFAEDAFGGQFCIAGNRICSFDPETGRLREVATTIDEWASVILADYEVLTGHPLIHEWQVLNGRLPGRQRLMPRIPFVAGGEFAVSNLIAVDAGEAMRIRGAIALQIRDLPDGTQIRFEISE